jgi:hypothetical protein
VVTGLVRAVVLAAACAVAAGCGSAVADETAAPARAASCPAKWRAGWEKLAERADATVFCPSWMPNPLDGQIGGGWTDIDDVDADGSYLVSFIWQESHSGEVHVNFRRYRGTAMPRCRASDSRKMIPCFADPAGKLRVGPIDATLYTVGRDADQWHLTYLWRYRGATYAVGEHVAPPLTYAKVKRNVERLLRGLVRVQP